MNPKEQMVELPCLPSSVTLARHFVRDTLIGWGLPRLVEDAQLGTSELVANAVCHAGTDLHLAVRAGDMVTISIEDRDPHLRRPVAPEGDFLAERGRGLPIVAAISDDWGILSVVGGKVVWFSLAMPDSATTDADVLQMKKRPSAWSRHPQSRGEVNGISVSSRLNVGV